MQRLGEFFARLAQRWLPDPFALACLLTLLVIAAAVVWPQAAGLRGQPLGARAGDVVEMWSGAVWNPAFLAFALQMCVVLLTGFGLARAPLALAGLSAAARLARSNRGAVYLIALVSCVGCWINWGFGLILAGVLATELRLSLARKGVTCQYALIVAAAYAGMMVWHGGFSGSAPLKVATDGVTIGAGPTAETIAPITIETTILNPANLGLALALFSGVPLLLATMARRRVEPSAAAATDNGAASAPATDRPPRGPSDRPRPADRINESRLLPIMLALVVLTALGRQVYTHRAAAVGLDFVNSAFLASGLLLHRNLSSYLAALAEGGRAIVGIVVQFPLYSGIQGVMFGAGLAAAISQGFIDVAQGTAEWLGASVAHTFPVATLLSAAVVNFFVPSGGGQWIVQGPIMCEAARTLGVPLHQTVMAVAYGDQLTNMVQPFWAIPLMGLTKVNAREFMGYCALLMLLAAPVFAAALCLM